MADIKLKEIVSWSKGHSVPRDDTSVSKNIPYLHYGDLYKKYNFRLDLNKEYKSIIKIDPDSKIKPEQYLHDGDIVFTLTSETVDDLGCCTLISNPEDLPFVTGMETTVVHILDKNVVYPPYLNYLFQTNRLQKELRQYVTGMKVYRVHPKDLMNITVNVPSYDIQKKVASFLDTISDKIVINHDINANLHDQIFSEFQYVRKSNKLNEVVLMDLCSFISRGVSPKYENNTGYWVLGQTCIRNHIVSMNNARTLISKDYGDKTVHKGDILVNSTGVGSLGRVAQLWFEHPHLVADSHISIVRPKIGYEEYLGCFMMSIEDEIENMAEGSTGQTELPRRSLMQMMISIPEMDILKLFGEKVRPLFDLIYKNLEINEKLTKIRDTLLPKLMSGEIDVSQLNLGD